MQNQSAKAEIREILLWKRQSCEVDINVNVDIQNILSDGKAEQMKISNHGAPLHRHRYGADLAITLRVTGMDLRLID